MDSPLTQRHLRHPSFKDANSASRVERPIQPKKFPDAKAGSASQMPAISVTCNSQSRASTKTALGRKAPTEQHLLGSKSNYEIIQSGKPLPSSLSFPSSLQAGIGKKRAQHQRDEKFRRDRMRRALETLAAVLPQELDPSRAGSRGRLKHANRAETVEQAIEYINILQKGLNTETNASFNNRQGRPITTQ